MNCEKSKEHLVALAKLSKELQLFLNKTESSLVYAKGNFKQVEDILKPWKIQNNFNPEREKCLCGTPTNIHTSENDEELALLSTISKTLSVAELMKRKSLKTKSNDSNMQRQSETSIRTKLKMPQTQTVKKCTSTLTMATNNSAHNPCCPLFETSIELTTEGQYLNIPEALTFYRIPFSLIRTIKRSNNLLDATEKLENIPKNSYKYTFIKNLEAQNEKNYSSYQEKDSSIGKFFSYFSVLHTLEKKRENVSCISWIFYKNANSLEEFHNSRFNIITKDSWSIILNLIVNEFIPCVKCSELDPKQKLQIFKILKTICNFVQSTVPSVPLFRIQINESRS